MSRLRVSVVIPTYNRAHLIGRAIRSAIAALTPDDEIIVVDDASTDHTAAIVSAYSDRVRYVLAHHGGAGGARNVGLQHVTGDLVAFLDSDDEWDNDKIRLQRSFLECRPDVLFCCANFRSKSDDGVVEPGYLIHWHKNPQPWSDIIGPGVLYSTIAPLNTRRPDFWVHVGSFFLRELQADYMATTTVIIRRREAGEALRFADDIRISEDKECFAKVARLGSGAYFDTDLSTQWSHSGPRVSDTNHFALASAKLLLIDRIWAADPQFVAEHGSEIERIREAQYLKRARWLLARGRTAEAGQDLRRVNQAPLSYRAFAALPEPLARGALTVRKWLRKPSQTTVTY